MTKCHFKGFCQTLHFLLLLHVVSSAIYCFNPQNERTTLSKTKASVRNVTDSHSSLKTHILACIIIDTAFGGFGPYAIYAYLFFSSAFCLKIFLGTVKNLGTGEVSFFKDCNVAVSQYVLPQRSLIQTITTL